MAGGIYLALLALLPAGMPVLPLLGVLMIWWLPAAQRPAWGWRLDWPTAALLAVLLSLLAVGATPKGAAQLLMCVATVLLFQSLAEQAKLAQLAWSLPVLCAAAALLFMPLTVLLQSTPDWLALMLVPGDHGGVRLRFVFPEPNPLAFVLYFTLLHFWPQIAAQRMPVKALCIAGAFAGVISIGSPLAILGIVLLCLSLAARLPPGQRVLTITGAAALLAVLVLNPPANLAGRADLLLSGEDNSLNLRTWGALAIAEVTLSDGGQLLTGAGIGNGRAQLEDNPYMALFAAQEESALPSMLAGALLEAGYLGLAALVALLLLGIWRGRGHMHTACAGVLLLMHVASGSYFFDTTVWAALGIQLAARPKANPSRAHAGLT